MNLILLRASAIFLGLASVAGLFVLDLPGIGFIEAQLLAFVIAMLLLRARPVVYAQLTAAIVQVSLGAANMLFWRVLVDDSFALVGAALISCSFLLAALHLLAAGSGLRPALMPK